MCNPENDWTPDQDRGSVAMIALQRMLVQYDGSNILLLPAWPKEWNVQFKLQGPNNTSIEGIFENGEMLELKKTPENSISKIEYMN